MECKNYTRSELRLPLQVSKKLEEYRLRHPYKSKNSIVVEAILEKIEREKGKEIKTP